jgi:hypothetical protein
LVLVTDCHSYKPSDVVGVLMLTSILVVGFDCGASFADQ